MLNSFFMNLLEKNEKKNQQQHNQTKQMLKYLRLKQIVNFYEL